MVRWGAYTPPVPNRVVECLQQNVDEVGCIPTPPADYKPGDRLRIMLLMEIMKQPQKMTVSESMVART